MQQSTVGQLGQQVYLAALRPGQVNIEPLGNWPKLQLLERLVRPLDQEFDQRVE